MREAKMKKTETTETILNRLHWKIAGKIQFSHGTAERAKLKKQRKQVKAIIDDKFGGLK